MADKQLITPKQAAEILGVSIHTLRYWRQSGKDKPKYRRVTIGRQRVAYELDSVAEHKKTMRGDK